MRRNYEYIGLICARGGSKGIPNKNIREFQGQPLIGWAVEAARKAGLLEKVIVSTDSEKINTRYAKDVILRRESKWIGNSLNAFGTLAPGIVISAIGLLAITCIECWKNKH